LPADRQIASHAVLAVDTCGAEPGVALALGDQIREARPATVGARADEVAALAAKLLSQAGLAVGDVAGLGVTVGPGSYTGVRIGLALVRGLSLVDRTPVVGVGSLELLALAAEGNVERLCPLLDAGTDVFYAAVYERARDGVIELCAPRTVARSELAEFLSDNARDAAIVRTAGEREIESDGHIVLEAPALRAGRLAMIARAQLAAGRGARADSVMPLYVGPSNARPNRNKVVVARSRLE